MNWNRWQPYVTTESLIGQSSDSFNVRSIAACFFTTDKTDMRARVLKPKMGIYFIESGRLNGWEHSI